MGAALVFFFAACSGGSGDLDASLGAEDGTEPSADAPAADDFSFFVTSLSTMREQSGSVDGFGGNLGGLAGADAICQTAAAKLGFENREWRADTDPASTCFDWTSSVGAGTEGRVMCGHSFPRLGKVGYDWISDHPVRGCTPGTNFVQDGPGIGDCVGCGGGYGGIYCFAI